jgi:hypothetical protein
MKMKQKPSTLFAILLAIMMFMYQYSFGEAKGKEPLQEMKTMAHVLQKNSAHIQEWTIYTREYTPTIKDDAAFLKKFNELKRDYPSFQWRLETDQHVQKATGLYEHSSIQEKIQLVTTVTKEKPQTYILYEVKGFSWSEKVWKEVSEKIRQKSSQLFIKQPAFFSCIKGEFSDKMKGVLLKRAYHLLHEFEATPVEALREETFVSISAYTGQWENVLPTKTHPMNIQLALRKEGLGGKTTVVVGTPIITIEY